MFFFFFPICCLYAQTQKNDSNGDFEVNLFINFLSQKDRENAIKIGEKLIKRYPQEGIIYIVLGRTYLEVNDYDRALELANQAEKIVESEKGRVLLYILFGRSYLEKYKNFEEENDEKKEELLNKALKYYKLVFNNNPDEETTASINNYLGIIYCFKKDFKTAIEHFNKSVKFFEKNNSIDILPVLLNLADAYSSIQNYNEAYNTIIKCLNLSKINKNQFFEAEAYNFLGLYYYNIGNKKLAKENLQKARDIYQIIDNEEKIEIINDIILKI